MKRVSLFIGLMLLATLGSTQNIDSIFSEPQTLELSVSTPQPRLKETFQISIDINHLRANIFKSLAGKVQLASDISVTDNAQMIMNVTAVQKGKNEVGPLVFFLDKTKYTTNKISFEVVEALPNTNKGLWFRKVMTSDSTFCIIIEQRIPADTKTTQTASNTTSYTTEPETENIVKFKYSYSINGVSGFKSHSATNFSSVTINGEDKQFMYGYSVYYFNIEDRKARIKISKNVFDNLPNDYQFEDIVVQ